MSTPSIKKNIVLSTAYQILTLITPFITAPYVSRVLEPDGIGVYSFTNSILSYFTMFAVLGTSSYGARQIARVRDDIDKLSKNFFEIELLSIVTSSICIALWLILILCVTKYQVIYLILTISLVGCMADISWFFTGLEQFSYIVVRNTIVKLVCIALLFVFIKSKDDLYLYIFLMTMANFLGTLSMWLYIPKMVKKVKWKDLDIRPHFKQTCLFFLPTVASSIYLVMDKTLIGLITKSEAENGYYEQATKIVNMAKVLTFSALNSVLSARTSYLYAEGKFDEIKSRINKSLNFVLFMGIGISCGIIAVANRFVPWFFGAGYQKVVILLQVLSPIIVIIGISNIIGSHYYTAVGAEYQKRAARYMMIGAAVNLCLNLALIPYLQSLGAVIASLAAETIITCLFLYNSDGYMNLIQIFRLGWKKLIAGALMILAMFFIGRQITDNTLAVLSEVVVGLATYFIVLYLFKDSFLSYLYYGILKPKLSKILRK